MVVVGGPQGIPHDIFIDLQGAASERVSAVFPLGLRLPVLQSASAVTEVLNRFSAGTMMPAIRDLRFLGVDKFRKWSNKLLNFLNLMAFAEGGYDLKTTILDLYEDAMLEESVQVGLISADEFPDDAADVA